MTEKDLDIAIEKCECIMEMDTRTMQNPVSENGWIFEKVYELLQYLRQFQFATDKNVGGTSDTISRRAVIDAVDGVDWYHQNQHGEMVSGANSDEHQAWYKAEDIYKAIEGVPPAQPDIPNINVIIDTIKNAINASTGNDAYMVGLRNGMKWCWSALTDKEPEYEDIPFALPSATVGGTDTISRSMAIDAFAPYAEYESNRTNAEWVRRINMVLTALPSAQPGWTYIEEALPKTIINEHTHDFQEYNCLCDFGEYGFDVRTYKFGNGHFWNGGGAVDKYVTAWQPLPEIPDALEQKSWEGEKP